MKASVSQSLLQNSRSEVNGDNCKVNKIYEYSVYEHTQSLCCSDTVWYTVYMIYKDCTGS